MLLNHSHCAKLTVDYVNTATGVELHRFRWVEGDHENGAIHGIRNYLVDVKASSETKELSSMLHWTLGGPWFPMLRTRCSTLMAKWFSARGDAVRL